MCPGCANARWKHQRERQQQLRAHRDTLRSRLEQSLVALDASSSSKTEGSLREATNGRAAAADQLAVAQARLLSARDAARELAAVTQGRQTAVLTAEKQLAARRAHLLGAVLPDSVRSKKLQLNLVTDKLVTVQRTQLLLLQDILPLKLLHERSTGSGSGSGDSGGSVATSPSAAAPCASAGASAGTARKAGAAGTQDPSRAGSGSNPRPLVSIVGRRLPQGLGGWSEYDDGEEAQEMGTALGHLALFIHLTANILGAPLLHEMAFWGSRTRMWQPDSFWKRQAGETTLVHVLAPLPAVSPAAAAAAIAAEVRPSIASQLAHNPVGAFSALAHRSARRLWGNVAGGLNSYGASFRADSAATDAQTGALSRLPPPPPSTAVARALSAADAEAGRREAEAALRRALVVLHRTAAAVVADQLGPRVLWARWDSFARLAALVTTALEPIYRQEVQRARAAVLYSNAAASVVHGGSSVSSSVLCTPGPLDSRMVSGSVLLPLLQGCSIGGEQDSEEWDFVPHPAGATSAVPAGNQGGNSPDGGSATGGEEFKEAGVPFLVPPPSRDDDVEQWARAHFVDAQGGEAPPRGNWRARQMAALKRELAPAFKAFSAKIPYAVLPARPGSEPRSTAARQAVRQRPSGHSTGGQHYGAHAAGAGRRTVSRDT